MVRKSVFAVVFLLSSFGVFSQQWPAAETMRRRCLAEGKLDSALYYAEEAAAILRGTVGEKNMQYAIMMRNMAVTNFFFGAYRRAEYYINKEVAIWESLRKTNDAEYITCLLTGSLISRKAGNYENALALLKKADVKALGKYPEESREYSEVLYQFAALYHDMGCSSNDMIYMNQEEKYLRKIEAILIKDGDKALPDILVNKADLAAWNNNVGNFPAAESLLKEVMESAAGYYGEQSTEYAIAINNLAVHYFNNGKYKESETTFLQAAEVFRKSPSSGKTPEAICLSNLGALYQEIGNYNVSSNLIEQASQLLLKNRQSENPVYALTLNNLAAGIISQQYYAKPENKNPDRIKLAGKKLNDADSIFRINCQKPHPFDISIRTNLSVWYNMTGDKKKSVTLLTSLSYDAGLSMKAISLINKMSFSTKFPASVLKMSGLEPAIIPVSVRMVDEVQASSMEMNQVLESDGLTKMITRWIIGKAENVKKVVGPYHPSYIELLKSFIQIYASNDDIKTEEELTLQYIDVINKRTLQDFSFLSESEKEMYYQMRLPDHHAFLSYSYSRKRTNPTITRYTYNDILINKGLMLKSSTAMRIAILNSNNPELLRKYDEWIALQKELSVLYSTPVEMRKKDVAELEKQAISIERSLVESSQEFSDYRKGLQVTWEDVKKSLKNDEAAIEFTDYRQKVRDGGEIIYYCALVLKPGSDYPDMIRLFTEDQLKAVIGDGDLSSVAKVNDIYGSASSPDDRLYNMIWKQLEPFIGDAKNIYISPAGLLNKISFPAISNGKGIYLCDRFNLQVKGSTGNLTSQNLFSKENRASALVFGGIMYSDASSGSEVWSYLKGTKDEGDAVNGILAQGKIDVQYLTGKNATESYFKQNAGNFNILHLATHGFFFGDPNEMKIEEKNDAVEFGEVTFRGSTRAYGVSSFVNNENPLMRSGLVLAGANDVWVKTEKEATDDGVLTAQEVTQIDLRRSDLVVLSACETGLGDIKGSEGVYGLQRSLKMAGVKYIIMSLWEIPDRETVEFMQKFYDNLLVLKDIRESFHITQKAMRSKYDPYYWGAFVLLE